MNDKPMTIHLVGHGHLDPVFMWRWQEGYEAARSTFRSALDRMNEFPDFRFTTTTTALMVAISKYDPDMFAEIQARVNEGRWELAGGWWVEPDTNLVHGESLVRQAMYGQLELARLFGKTARIGMNPDTFGHCAVLPQILCQSGAAAYVFMRPEKYEASVAANSFNWQGPGGYELPAFRLQSYNAVPSDGLLAQLESEPFYSGNQQLIVYGVGNHGGGPTREALDYLERQIADRRTSELRYSSLEGFADAATGFMDQRMTGELQHHARGCYSTMIGLKQANRRTEYALLAAERWASLAAGTEGYRYPHEQLTAAWKDALFCQFHDILPGTCTAEAEEDAQLQLGRARFTAMEVLHSAVNHLAARIDTATDHTPFILFNPATADLDTIIEIEVDIRHWERGNPTNSQTWWAERPLVLLDSNGRQVDHNLVQPTGYDGNTNRLRVAFRALVPALGYSVYQYLDPAGTMPEGDDTPGAPGCTVTETGELLTVSNSDISISVCKITGAVTSWYDHNLDCELLNDRSDVLSVYRDNSDTWAHEVRSFSDKAGEFEAAAVTVKEHGPVRTVLLIRSRFGKSEAVRTIAVPTFGSEVTVVTKVNWQEKQAVLKSCWNLNLALNDAVSSTPYQAVRREPGAGEEPGGEWQTLRGDARDDSGQWNPVGWQFINDSCWSYEINAKARRYSWGRGQTAFALTLLRSPAYAFHEPNEVQADQHYEWQNQGWHTFRFVISAGAPRSHVTAAHAAEHLNHPVTVVREHQHPGVLPREKGFLEQQAAGSVLSVLKQAEDGGGFVLRAVDYSENGSDASFRIKSLGVDIKTRLAAGQIRSWRIVDGSTCEVNLLEQKPEHPEK